MKYRILFMGSDQTMITEVFEQLSEDFELMTTSIRYRDIDSHLKIFKPNMYVYCLRNEKEEDIKHIAEMRSYLLHEGVEVAVIGSEEECVSFQNMTLNMAGLVINTPAITSDIISTLEEFVKGKADKLTDEAADRRRHVLVIDDDPQMLRVIKEILHDEYDVATAISGKVAFKFLEKRNTDLILLDFEMPDENGPEVLVKLREKQELSDLPVLFLTGNTGRDKIKEAMALNPQGYLVKPIDKAVLIDSIKKLIG